MIGSTDDLARLTGRKSDATSPTGSLMARVLELLNRFTTTIAGRIDAALSSRLTAAVNSVQYGTIAVSSGTSNTATITSVSTTKAVVELVGHENASQEDASNIWARQSPIVDLTNATTVTASLNQANAGGYNRKAYFCVTEYK